MLSNSDWCNLGYLGLIGDNKPSWIFFELAAQAAGGMSLGVYRDTLDEEVGYLMDAAKVSFVYAEDQEQVDKILTIKRPKNNPINIFYRIYKIIKRSLVSFNHLI